MLKYILTFAFMVTFKCIGHSQELTVHQGFWKMLYYEDSNEISRKEFENNMKSLPAANEAWNKSKSNFVLASASGIISGFGFGFWIAADSGDNKTPWISMAIGGSILSIIFNASASNSRKNAILTYNSQFDSGGIRVTPASSGVGIAINF